MWTVGADDCERMNCVKLRVLFYFNLHVEFKILHDHKDIKVKKMLCPAPTVSHQNLIIYCIISQQSNHLRGNTSVLTIVISMYDVIFLTINNCNEEIHALI